MYPDVNLHVCYVDPCERVLDNGEHSHLCLLWLPVLISEDIPARAVNRTVYSYSRIPYGEYMGTGRTIL